MNECTECLEEKPVSRTQKGQATGRDKWGRCAKEAEKKENSEKGHSQPSDPEGTPGGQGKAPGLWRRFTAQHEGEAGRAHQNHC